MTLEETKTMSEFQSIRDIKKTPYNSTYPKGGVLCSVDTFVVKESAVLRMNICAEKPAHHKSAKRYTQPVRFVATVSELQND
jgi:hypothetical protein